jgi:hypothetical protein
MRRLRCQRGERRIRGHAELLHECSEADPPDAKGTLREKITAGGERTSVGAESGIHDVME